jgi:formate hydrogenlyase subunit 3/multisubunit Na+/H+ antiporter MnhD subunit
MMETRMLLTASVLLPLVLLLACVSPRLRARMPSLLALAPLPALAAAVLAIGDPPLALHSTLFRVTLRLDLPGAMLLGAAALLWIAAGAFAAVEMRGQPNRPRFSVWWLLTLTGNLGVFLAADLSSFYLFFALVSLSAYGLVVYDGTPRARRAGGIYVALALLGEAALLMGFVLLAVATPGDSLLIRDAVAALPTSPWRDATLALLIAGFGLKIGLVPLHVWMPLAYSAAPFPASAAMSGAAVKAGVIGLIRFLPFDSPQPGWGSALAIAGMCSAFYGVAIGVTQRNPKAVLAYSSVSQMGLLAAVFGMGLAAGDASTASAASFYAAHHVLVKGGLFLALGVAARTTGRRAWLVLLPAAVLALSLAGLPLTGGALAKWAVKTPLGEGTVGTLATLASAGSTLLMLHFLHRLVVTSPGDAGLRVPRGLSMPWLATALASIVLPWALFRTVSSSSFLDVHGPASLWKACWPIAIGAVLAVALRRFEHRLPRLPEGDWVVAAEPATRVLQRCGEAMEHADEFLRRWPVAGVSLLAAALLLGTLVLASP